MEEQEQHQPEAAAEEGTKTQLDRSNDDDVLAENGRKFWISGWNTSSSNNWFNTSSLYNVTYFTSYINNYLTNYYSGVYNQTWVQYPWYGPTAGMIDMVVMFMATAMLIMGK